MAVVKIYHGANETKYINLDCKIQRITTYLQEACPYPSYYVLDVADMDGNLKHIDDNPQDQASVHLKDNTSYILCNLRTDSEGKKKYEVLVENVQTYHPEFVLETERSDTPKRSLSQASNSGGTCSWSRVRRKSRAEVRTTSSLSSGSKSKAGTKSKESSAKSRPGNK